MNPTMRLTAFLLLAPGLLGACAGPLLAVAPCIQYCVSRDDGYQWAQRAHLTDSRNCEGYAKAFTGGCRDAVTDYQQSLAPGRDGL
jgi:hypothetical protein